ncbi:hypothetical protein Tco_0837009, partial [Tanacetum coccineum]
MHKYPLTNDVKANKLLMSVQALRSSGQKASDSDNSDPCPKTKILFLQQKRQIRVQQGWNFSSDSLYLTFNIQHTVKLSINNNDHAPKATFQEAELCNPFCKQNGYKKLGESSSRNIDITRCAFHFKPQEHPSDTLVFTMKKGNPCLSQHQHKLLVEARSWSIPFEDPYEEAARQLLEQAPHSPEYVPDPMELEDHVPVYIPEPEHPEDLVPAEDEAPTPPLPPFFLSPRIRPPHTRALEAEMRDVASFLHHSLHPSGTPPLLPIPLPAPSTSRRADIPEADTPPRKRLLLTTPRPSCEVGESSAAAARQPGPTMAHRVDCSSVDTMETRIRDTERRMMTALEMVNMRVSYQVDVRSRESSEFYSRHHDAQKDRAAVRAEIEVLRRERLAYEQESIQTRQDLARSEAHYRALEARVTVLETVVRHHEWQRHAADDLAVQHIMRTQALEAGAPVDTLEDTG